ncbi:hypothetical protein KKC13_06620 [bacterium]|nr:hypothetical protein [bacterium]MBU1956775.1 hypothetical protein [bacterium]
MLDIVSAVSIFVVGQFILKSIIEPIQELKKEIASILGDMVYYANIYSNPGIDNKETIENVSSILRKHSSNLITKVSIIPFYNVWYYLRIIPNENDIKIVSERLIGLSNSLHSSPSKVIDDGYIADKNFKYANEIKKLLTKYYSRIPITKLIILFGLIVLFVYLLLSLKDQVLETYCDRNSSIVKSSCFDFNGTFLVYEK